jgi:hypothetical protein
MGSRTGRETEVSPQCADTAISETSVDDAILAFLPAVRVLYSSLRRDVVVIECVVCMVRG